MGDRIKAFRKRLNLTQKDLAIQMGFNSPETVSQIERGDRELKAWELVKLAKLLSVNLNDLLSIEELQEKPVILWREKLEKIANVFASCILLPSDVVTVEFEKNIDKNSIAYIDLIGTARKFDVSTEALLFRLLNLKLLGKNTVDNILKDQLFREIDKSTMAPRWWRPPKFPERFVRLAFVAYNKGRLSKAKLAEILDTSLIDLPKTLQEYGHKDREGYDAEVRVA